MSQCWWFRGELYIEGDFLYQCRLQLYAETVKICCVYSYGEGRGGVVEKRRI